MNVSEIQYLREKEVHKLFEHIVKTLLRTKPPNPKEFLISSLAAKGVGESDTAHQQQHHHQQQVHQQFLNETVKSITSTRSSRLPTPGYFHKKKRVQLRDSVDLLEITDVSERIKRGDFWFEGEIEDMKNNLQETHECHICSTEPNVCETSLYTLFSETNGAWHIVCNKESCLEQVKPWWEFCYTMGDTLNRCDIYTLQLIMSFVGRRERARLAAVAMDWREAFWTDLKFTKQTISSLSKALSAPSFSVLTSSVVVAGVPSLESTYFDLLISKLATSTHISSITLTNCDISIAGYERLVTLGLQSSIQSVTDINIGPLSFEVGADKHQQSLMRLLSFLCTGIGVVTITFKDADDGLSNFLSQLSPEGVRIDYN